MLGNLLKVIHVLEACNKNTWECWTCMGCNQQRWASDTVRTRSWRADSKNYYVWDFDAGSWYDTCRGKIRSMAASTKTEGTLCHRSQCLDSNHYQWTKKFITRDEWWVYSYDPEIKAQLSQWKLPGSPCPKKPRQSRSKIKTKLTVFLIGTVLSSRVCPSWPNS